MDARLVVELGGMMVDSMVDVLADNLGYMMVEKLVDGMVETLVAMLAAKMVMILVGKWVVRKVDVKAAKLDQR
jgi:hypothetical protein